MGQYLCASYKRSDLAGINKINRLSPVRTRTDSNPDRKEKGGNSVITQNYKYVGSWCCCLSTCHSIRRLVISYIVIANKYTAY